MSYGATYIESFQQSAVVVSRLMWKLMDSPDCLANV